MPRLIDAEKLAEILGEQWCDECMTDDCYYCNIYKIKEIVRSMPTVDAEPTEEQVKEYCRKRCLVIVSSELFNEMKARWGVDSVRHGRWINTGFLTAKCSVCDAEVHELEYGNYCPNCGARMDEEGEDEAD